MDLHPSGATAGQVAQAMLEAGVIVRPIGDVTLAVCPPLVMTDAEADRVVDTLVTAVGS